MVLEPIIYQKTGGTSLEDYPVGSVILSASQNVGSEWLRCDGSYINESEYPELTAVLGKNSPGVQNAVKAGDGSVYNGTFSTSYLFEGCVWVYSFQNGLLLGFPVSGDPVLEIPVTGSFDFIESPEVPVVLSICGERVFLAQKTESKRMKLFTGMFSMAASSVAMTAIAVDAAIAAAATSTDNIVNCYPEVVNVKDFNLNNVVQDCFAVCVGETEAISSTLYYLVFPASNVLTVECKSVVLSTSSSQGGSSYNMYRIARSLKRFSKKTANELFYIQCGNYNGASTSAKQMSLLRGTYTKSTEARRSLGMSEITQTTVAPLITGQHYIYNVQLSNSKINLRAGNAGENEFTLFPTGGQEVAGITLSPYASLFPDSLVYVSSHDLYVIFVGTGILFSHSPLDMGSWGYLDTTEYFGIITQWGCVEFDIEENTLCLSGRDTYGEYVCGLLRLHEQFNYSNDGAWLPYIASSGVPAWIKAKSTAEA